MSYTDFEYNYTLEGPEKCTSILPVPAPPMFIFIYYLETPLPPSGGRPLYTVPKKEFLFERWKVEPLNGD